MSRITNIQDAGFEVVRRLREHGHAALWAGGCVRDMLLGIDAADVDVATDAPPDRVSELFSNTRQVGAAFGVVLVRQGKFWVETATFRTDLSYKDGRRPEGVIFSTPQNDAQRRDFTINGLFYDPIEKQIIDYIGGEADLRAGIIRAIGEPERRFAEDHLRLLRAVRFAARFNFEIDPLTTAAIQHHASELTKISAERIREELDKMLSHPSRSRALQLLADLNLLPHLWSGAPDDLSYFPASQGDTQGDSSPQQASPPQTISRLLLLPETADFVLAMAAILLATPPERVSQIGRALRCSNEQIAAITWLVKNEPSLHHATELSLASFKRLLAHRRWQNLLTLHQAALLTTAQPLTTLDACLTRAAAIPRDQIAPPPFIVGDDLLTQGLQPGPRFKQILSELYDAQLNNEVHDREEALTRLQLMMT